MTIMFEIKDKRYCVTPCPYGFIDGYTGNTKKVGGNGCSKCRHFVSIDLVDNSIECGYDG